MCRAYRKAQLKSHSDNAACALLHGESRNFRARQYGANGFINQTKKQTETQRARMKSQFTPKQSRKFQIFSKTQLPTKFHASKNLLVQRIERSTSGGKRFGNLFGVIGDYIWLVKR